MFSRRTEVAPWQYPRSFANNVSTQQARKNKEITNLAPFSPHLRIIHPSIRPRLPPQSATIAGHLASPIRSKSTRLPDRSASLSALAGNEGTRGQHWLALE